MLAYHSVQLGADRRATLVGCQDGTCTAFVVESGMDLNGEFTTEFDTYLGESTFETGAVYGILSTNADGLISGGAGVITLTSQDPTQFMNLQNGT